MALLAIGKAILDCGVLAVDKSGFTQAPLITLLLTLGLESLVHYNRCVHANATALPASACASTIPSLRGGVGTSRACVPLYLATTRS